MSVEEADSILKAARQSAKHKTPGVHFLKIQKTGSSSLGDWIIPHFCKKHETCVSGTHMEWNQATQNGMYKGPVVTLLRDPIDRALSEFFYLRDTDGHSSAKQPQWDFRNMSWIDAIQGNDLDKALETFIHGYPKNPSRNRMALYLLGFRDGGRAYDVKDRVHVAPGEMYDWDKNPREMMRRALHHLLNLTAFGITDCWVPSMKAIAGELGWPVSEVLEVASDRHERNWRLAMVDRRKPDYWLLKKWLGTDIDEHTKWSKLIPKKYIEEIKKWQNVDVMLYAAAKMHFERKYNMTC